MSQEGAESNPLMLATLQWFFLRHNLRVLSFVLSDNTCQNVKITWAWTPASCFDSYMCLPCHLICNSADYSYSYTDAACIETIEKLFAVLRTVLSYSSVCNSIAFT